MSIYETAPTGMALWKQQSKELDREKVYHPFEIFHFG